MTALAMFQGLAGRDTGEAAPYLKTYLEKDLQRTVKTLRKRIPDVRAAVEATDLSAFA